MRKLNGLLYEEDERVGVVTLNKPERLNALGSLMDELLGLLEELAIRDQVGAIIITGAPRPDGRPCFSAGGDLKEVGERGGVPRRLHITGRSLQDAILSSAEDGAEGRDYLPALGYGRVVNFPKPVIAAIDGICTAGGLELALCCDLRVISENARISDLHMKNLGDLGSGGLQTRLPRIVGLAKAKELIWTGTPIDGKEALRIGLANQVFPSAKLMEGAKTLAKRLASMDAYGMRVSKMVLNASMSQTSSESLRFSDLCFFLARYMRGQQGSASSTRTIAKIAGKRIPKNKKS